MSAQKKNVILPSIIPPPDSSHLTVVKSLGLVAIAIEVIAKVVLVVMVLFPIGVTEVLL